MNARLQEGCRRLGLGLSDGQLSQLETYMARVLECNRTYNLMKAASADELAASHVLDSLTGVSHIRALLGQTGAAPGSGEVPLCADIGSGGGCPGIPLAVAMGNVQWVLVERMERRCAFLQETVRALGLGNVTVRCTQADKLEPECFSLVVLRAFHPFDQKIAPLLLGMVRPHGYVVAYKARAQKIAEEMEAVRAVIPGYKKIPLTVPFLEDHERNLVIIQKRPEP